MEKIILSFGGNALGITHEEQIEKAKIAAKAIVEVAKDHHVAVVTGNGPISGNISLGLDSAYEAKVTASTYSLANVGAMTQGSIINDFIIAIRNEMRQVDSEREVVGIVTHTIVDKNDLRFNNPTKPIGAFYDADTAKKLAQENNWIMKEISGKGWRRHVASPLPVDILERNILQKLFVDGNLTICGVGGGTPIIDDHQIAPIDAVIDKDFTSALIADILGVDKMIILTEAEGVAINYGTKDQQYLTTISVEELQKLISKGEFPEGSMLPKVLAAIDFVKRTSKPAIIASLDNVMLALKGESGTLIHSGKQNEI